MKFFTLFLLAFWFILGGRSIPPAAAGEIVVETREGALREARRVADELSEKIRGLLFQELRKGGPEGAVRVCSEVAQEITREFNRQSGHEARRVSMRYRNPLNRPDGYEQSALMRMEADHRRNQMGREYVEVMKEQDADVLRYLRPLIVAPVCVTCHGPREKLSAGIKGLLAERYPEDLAVGFQEGDLRGAISVKIRWPTKKAE